MDKDNITGGVKNTYNPTSMERSHSALFSGVSSLDFQTMFHKLLSVEHDQLERSNLTIRVETSHGSTYGHKIYFARA